MILKYLEGYKEMWIEDKELEFAKECQDLIEGIKRDGITKHEKEVRAYAVDAFEAVCGMPQRYFGNDKDGMEFLNAVCEYYDPSA